MKYRCICNPANSDWHPYYSQIHNVELTLKKGEGETRTDFTPKGPFKVYFKNTTPVSREWLRLMVKRFDGRSWWFEVDKRISPGSEWYSDVIVPVRGESFTIAIGCLDFYGDGSDTFCSGYARVEYV